jgi:ABC-type transport system involved in resistance to organic solvents, auxiliary component
MSMTRTIGWLAAAVLSVASAAAHAQAKAPEVLIKQVSTDVLEAVKADKTIQAGELRKVIALVDQKVLPFVDFQRMTASAVGRYWRQATPDQQKRLEDEFKLLLVRTYSGALSQVSAEQKGRAEADALRPTDNEVVVRTEIRGKGIRSSSTTASRRRATPGRSTTSTCWASGWSRTTATASPGDRRQRHRRPDRKAGRAQQDRRHQELMLLLPATLTSREARVTLRMLKQALQSEGSEGPVVVEAASLQQLDSAALAVLLEIERLAVAWGRSFAVRGVPPKLAALAKLYGVDKLLLKPEGAPLAGAVDQRSPAT